MKKLIAIFAVLALALVPVAFSATDYESVCTPNGCSQGTLIRTLYNHQVAINDVITNVLANTAVAELKTDHDADNNEFALAVLELTELKADHDADNDVHAAVKAAVNSVVAGYNSSLVQIGTLVISADAVKFKTTTTAIAVVRGATITKAAADNLVFTAADTINTASGAGDFWGAWKVELGLDGTVYTHSVAADQAYANEAAAIAALPATTTGRAFLGYITVEANNGADWVANTDDLTIASDVQAANFVDNAVVTDVAVVAGAVAADLAAANPTGFAADLAAAVPTGAVVGAASYGTGTAADPRIQLAD